MQENFFSLSHNELFSFSDSRDYLLFHFKGHKGKAGETFV